ncbi:MAG: hypothetical protein AAF958_05175 [Planctomycetota bacterium]
MRIRSPHRATRGGYLYISVLLVTLVLMTIVTASLTQATARARSVGQRVDSSFAQTVAEGELHAIIVAARDADDWSAGQSNATWSAWRDPSWANADEIKHATVRHRWTDPDGDLGGDVATELRLSVQARVGRSRFAIEVQCEPEIRFPECLQYSVHASGRLSIGRDQLIQTDGTMALGSVRPHASADVAVTAPNMLLGSLPTASRRDALWGSFALASLPDQPTFWISRFAAVATPMNLASIPVTANGLELKDQTLNPLFNPWGGANLGGFYSLDAQGSEVSIEDMWVDGTIIVQNATKVTLRRGIRWDYAGSTPGPILLCDCPIEVVDHEVSTSTKFLAAQQYSRLNGIILTTGSFSANSTSDGSTLHLQGLLSAASISVNFPMFVEAFPGWGDPPLDELADLSVPRIKPQSYRAVAWED